MLFRSVQEVEVPNLEKMTVKEAKEAVKQKGLLLTIENEADFAGVNIAEYVVREQFPKPGIKILAGKSVRIQIEEGKK